MAQEFDIGLTELALAENKIGIGIDINYYIKICIYFHSYSNDTEN